MKSPFFIFLSACLVLTGCCWNKTVTHYPDGRTVTEYHKEFKP